jgi:hypothetical protein
VLLLLLQIGLFLKDLLNFSLLFLNLQDFFLEAEDLILVYGFLAKPIDWLFDLLIDMLFIRCIEDDPEE